MATVKIVKRLKMGNAKGAIVDFTFGSSYPTGGESLTPAQLGVGTVQFLDAAPNGGYLFAYDIAAKKLKAFVAGTAFGTPAQEAANAANLATIVARVLVIGW